VVADANAAAIIGGEAKSVEDGVGVLVRDAAGDERVDGRGDGDLDGSRIFQRGEVEERFVRDEAGDGDFVAVEIVGAVEAAVKEAKAEPERATPRHCRPSVLMWRQIGTRICSPYPPDDFFRGVVVKR
jgi:hypothetical protein